MHLRLATPPAFKRPPQCNAIASLTNSAQAVNLNPRPPLRSTSLNWDAHAHSRRTGQHSAPILSPRDIVQVAFILDQQTDTVLPETDMPTQVSDDKRLLGQLAIQWRGTLGDRGSLSTGWLTCRR
jgi:hypothetical protein